MMNSAVTLLALTALPGAYAWGDLAHMTVAYIAQNFVSSSTASWAQNILGDTSDSYMANVATWADSYRYTSAGSFSEPYHFIDANDNPPTTCNVEYSRDCADGNCVVAAIQNYTQRVQDTSLASTQISQALQFLIHFFGDVTQPLHDEGLEYGGNDIDVTFDGSSNNLHHIWDTDMPEKYRGGYSESDAQAWATQLTQEIQSGSYSSEASSWTQGAVLSDPLDSAMAWATDANAYVCSLVLKGGESAVEHGDLNGTYYQNAIPVFNLQIAKAGYRLAYWLDLIEQNSGSSSSGGGGGQSSYYSS